MPLAIYKHLYLDTERCH